MNKKIILKNRPYALQKFQKRVAARRLIFTLGALNLKHPTLHLSDDRNNQKIPICLILYKDGVYYTYINFIELL